MRSKAEKANIRRHVPGIMLLERPDRLLCRVLPLRYFDPSSSSKRDPKQFISYPNW